MVLRFLFVLRQDGGHKIPEAAKREESVDRH